MQRCGGEHRELTIHIQGKFDAVYLGMRPAASTLRKSHRGVGEQENKLEKNMKRKQVLVQGYLPNRLRSGRS